MPRYPSAVSFVEGLAEIVMEAPEETYIHLQDPQAAPKLREAIRGVALALLRGDCSLPPDSDDLMEASHPKADRETIELSVLGSIPQGGFLRTDVSRLVLTFGRTSDVAPVRLALLVRPAAVLEQTAVGHRP